MALKKEIVKPNGITTSYHKISSVDLNIYEAKPNSIIVTEDTTVVPEETLSLSILVTSYLDESHRKDEQAIENNRYSMDISSDDCPKGSIRSFAYDKLKELPEWSDAEDC